MRYEIYLLSAIVSPYYSIPSSMSLQTVTAAIIEREDKVLIARRSPNSKLAGMWEFPGGKVELGESLQECLVRELNEELGIKVVVGRLLISSEYHYEHGSFRIHAFEADWVSGDISLRDHDLIEWVTLEEIASYSLLPADIPIAEKLKLRD